ncbi:serine protease [Ramlibacter sp.]|uniref:trypsin-like serine peptidase n=1 Tax=Ramlibacter sp. TaxID=1917967 RepID=UPI002D0DCDAA|nr:serine protease [Ramlibacter sp.]HWI81753.1 serine protease [Ramlibacter sp.]
MDSPAIEPLLLAATRVATFDGTRVLTAASGFFFQRGERLFVVTSRHVLMDDASGHHPDRIEITLHDDAVDLTRTTVISIPLYCDGRSVWREGKDAGGPIDVAVVELDRAVVPRQTAVRPFTPAHLQQALEEIGIGASLLVVGFPLGFYDTVYRLPVARQAAVASAFGVRFQGQGFFLTDARLHRGSSGAPVVIRNPNGDPQLPWTLLGIHSARLDMGTREEGVDESLGLNCAWYADILLTLTE